MQLFQLLIFSYCSCQVHIFFFNPVRNLLKKRQDNVAAEIEAARKSKEEADALKAQYDEKLKNADTAADQILADARKKALQKEAEVISEAKEEAGRIIKRADNEIELEKKKAADDMKKEMIAVATMMAGKVVSASIDTDIQESLVDETLNEMGDNTWRNQYLQLMANHCLKQRLNRI